MWWLGCRTPVFPGLLRLCRVDPQQVEAVVKGIADGCEDAGCSLIGGETAEMPGFYPEGEYDLAGSAWELWIGTRSLLERNHSGRCFDWFAIKRCPQQRLFVSAEKSWLNMGWM